MNDDFFSALNTLGYSPLWLESGFLEAEWLQAQVLIYRQGDDKNTEHYRYAAFRQILASRSALDDMQVADYIALAQLDEDPAMGMSALCLLIDWKGLTAEQRDNLSRQPAFATPVLQKRLLRRHLIDSLEAGPLTAELFERCITCGDSFVQRVLVETPDLLPAQLKVLSEHGANRAIRNLAKTRMKRRSVL